MLTSVTLDQLRVFIAVVDTGSFSAAARNIGCSQSAVSQVIQTLETSIGLTLFDRRSRTPKLTGAGNAIADEARFLLRDASRLAAKAESIANDLEPCLSVAVHPIFPNTILVESMRDLHLEFPDLPVQLFHRGISMPERRLRGEAVSLAIYPLLGAAAMDLEAELLTRIRFVPVVAADHPLAAIADSVSREDLEEHTQLDLDGSKPFNENSLGGIASRNSWRFGDHNTRLQYLFAGIGWCNMPLHMVKQGIDDGRLKRLRPPGYPDVELATYVVKLRGRALGRAGRWLVAALRRKLAAEGMEPGSRATIDG